MKIRTIKLLKRLLSVSYPVSVEQLSDYFSVSTRTVQSLVKEANEYLETINVPLIQTIRKKGVNLKVTNEEKEQIVNTIFSEGYFYLDREERELDILLSIAFSGKPLFINQKEDEFLVSKSTIDEDMRRIRKSLMKYDISIISMGKQGSHFFGSERSIRTMLFDVINRQIGVIDLEKNEDIQLSINKQILYKYISKQMIRELSLLVNTYFKKLDDNLYKKQILLFTVIWIKRLEKNEEISSVNWETDEVESLEASKFISKLIEIYKIEPKLIEINYLQFIIETFNANDNDNLVEWVNTQLLTINLMKFVEEKTSIPFHKKEEKLYESLYKHIYQMIGRIKSDVQVFNPIEASIKKNYGKIYDAVKQFAPQIKEIIGYEISDSELSFLVIHFSTVSMYVNEDVNFIFKSVIVCNHGIATSNLLAANLKKKYPQIDVVAILSSQDIGLIKKLDVDLVFSTYPIEYIEKPLLVIDPFITKESSHAIKVFLLENNHYGRIEISTDDQTDLFYNIIEIINQSNGAVDEKIYAKLQNLFDDNELKINLREIQPMLKDKLLDDYIILNQEVDDWEDAIEVSAKPLLKKRIIEPKYLEAMVNSVKEHGPYIVIGKNLALAHARPEDGVNELGISVVTLSKPIKFGNEDLDPVKIIFCLSATDSYSHLNIMKELVSLINDENRLENLITSKTKKEFKEILFEENNLEKEK